MGTEHRSLGGRVIVMHRYSILEKDGVTLAELASDEHSALMAAPKDGRIIQRDGVTRYVAEDGCWVWTGVRE